MSKKPNIIVNSTTLIKAISIESNEVIFEGYDGREVIKKAKESGENYILDFETEPSYNFLF